MLSTPPYLKNSKPNFVKLCLDKVNSKNKLAFSLIEISVVILVIGILIAGISKGMDLYQDFKLSTARSLTMNSRVGRIDGLSLWFETTSEKSFSKILPSDNSLIEVWNDINPQRTQKFNVSQNVDANKPYYISQGINGLPALKFVAPENRRLTTPIRVLDVVSYNQATIFMVQNNFNGDHRSSQFFIPSLLNIHATWEDKRIYWDFGGCCDSTQIRLYTAVLPNFAGKNKILTFTKNVNNLEIRVNKNETLAISSVATATFNSNISSRLNIGGSSYIGEIIVFNRALTSEERLAVEEYLSQKWGIKLFN